MEWYKRSPNAKCVVCGGSFSNLEFIYWNKEGKIVHGGDCLKQDETSQEKTAPSENKRDNS